MTEVKALCFGETFEYRGLIDTAGFYKLLDKWFHDHGYDKTELWNFEEVYEDGKQLTLRLQPYKKISDIAKIEIRITGEFKRCKDVIVEKNHVKRKLMKGDAKFIFDVFLTTDYEDYWGTNPMYFFLKTLADKFLYRNYLDRYEELAMTDKEELKREMKAYLNMQRFN